MVKKNLQFFKYFLLFTIQLSLLGCANIPAQLGVGDLEWNSYSKEKQQALLTNYNQLAKEREQVIEQQADNKNSSSTFLTVSIYNGKVMFPPAFINWQSYRPVQFDILREECRNVEVSQLFASEVKTELGVCFYDNILHLDSSHYDATKKVGSVRIYYSPLWLSSFTYQGISSSGHVRLNNVTITITQKELPPQPKTGE